MANIGKITQIIGPVVDVGFEGEYSLPQILDALEVTRPDGQIKTQRHAAAAAPVRSVKLWD